LSRQNLIICYHCALKAIASALLFTVGKSLIGLYLGKTAVGSAYGAVGSLVVIIVWVYYSAMIFLFGAEFTHVLGRDDRTRTPHAR
jgi:membrane protein